MPVNPVPEGYHSVTPYLVITGAAKAIDFYKKVFGATEVLRMDEPGTNRVGHAELKIGDSHIMLADEYPAMGHRSPTTLGGAGVSLLLYVPDCDSVVKQAVSAGAKLERPIQDQFYGDRSGTILDPFGHVWTIATHIEDLSPAELTERSKKALQDA